MYLQTRKNRNYKMKIYLSAFLIFIAAFLSGCGEGTLDVSEAKYEPKIVLEGYIYPGSRIEGIKISRNFPLNQTIDFSKAILMDARVNVTDIALGKTVALVFDPQTLSFRDEYGEIDVQTGKSYRLDVQAVIEGKTLNASSTTTVPLNGLEVIDGVGRLKYREKDEAGNIKSFYVTFKPAEKSDFYAFVVEALGPKIENFIYDNAFFEVKQKDVEDNWDRFTSEYTWLQNVKSDMPSFTQEIEWHQIWFYGEYDVTIYAGDVNFRDFLMTHNSVQEADGNFHEPKFHIEGEGIGVFGSAIKKTFRFRVDRP